MAWSGSGMLFWLKSNFSARFLSVDTRDSFLNETLWIILQFLLGSLISQLLKNSLSSREDNNKIIESCKIIILSVVFGPIV